uniref:uncharacterized protein LOC108950472 n=1 Tax=Ciona intestinalis TaxID=7719 RepID=UPI00089DD2D7|nr:uncharacterized protein LOC108950472 [Ciona intestinalis]|eukprot:XP_018671854.1 uncharacterized protein LOC108950472 [Ciona intestinalis]
MIADAHVIQMYRLITYCMDYNELVNEIQSIASEIKFAVTSVVVPVNNPTLLHITTLESAFFTLELTSTGFFVVEENNSKVEEAYRSTSVLGERFETIYAFLDTVSLKYRSSFASALSDKLFELNQRKHE